MSIVSVLVAVAIPVFSTQLEKAREATDLANMRDAKAAAVAMYLDDNENAGTYYWDAEKGTLVADKTGVNGYGKGTAKIGSSSNRFFDSTQEVYNAGVDCNGRIIKVIITDPVAANLNATIALSWDGATVVPSTPTEPSSSEEEPEEPPVVTTETIEAGTYRFIDAPSAPSSSMTANIAFSFEGQDPSDTLTQIQVNATSLIYSDGSMGFYSAYNFSETAWSTTYANIRTITISSDAEVSEEFYEWFEANANKGYTVTISFVDNQDYYAPYLIFDDGYYDGMMAGDSEDPVTPGVHFYTTHQIGSLSELNGTINVFTTTGKVWVLGPCGTPVWGSGSASGGVHIEYRRSDGYWYLDDVRGSAYYAFDCSVSSNGTITVSDFCWDD